MQISCIFVTGNIREILCHNFKRMSLLISFTLIDDTKFSWLRNVFQQYFEDWFVSIKQWDCKYSFVVKLIS